MFYEFLYDGLKANQPGAFQYFSVFLVRKLIYAWVVYYYAEDVHIFFQLYVNILLSFTFLLYLAHFKPFIDKRQGMINFWNEFTYYIVSMIYLTFTDYNKDAMLKLIMGWVVIIIVIINLIYPNGYVMVSEMWPDIRSLCSKEKRPTRPVRFVRRLDNKRKKFLEKYKKLIKMKREFVPRQEIDLDIPFPKSNQIVPDDKYP